MKNIVIGILAHVDAGKTTLSEAMLYETGTIRSLGRVDHKNAFLDTDTQERDRGITIFSKQVEMRYHDMNLMLLDTPGHVDFSAEMERTLQVLDYAVLVISGREGVQSHTVTLWKLLQRYRIPVFLFVNKMDLDGADRIRIVEELQSSLSAGCLDFDVLDEEQAAMCEESLLEEYLKTGKLTEESLQDSISRRKIFPCYFGSALRMDGVTELLDGLERFTKQAEYPEQFGARIYKITRDPQGLRLTHMKITGGSLSVKEILKLGDTSGALQEKVNQIRIYSGEKYQMIQEAKAGTVCAVAGLEHTHAGQGLGIEKGENRFVLEPAMSYGVLLPEGVDVHRTLQQLKQLEEEDPQLHIAWNSQTEEIQLQLMGEVQLEILKEVIRQRFDLEIEFGEGKVAYKETIAEPVTGAGHFEPLRHYAEVHLLLEPGEPGSGIMLDTVCREDLLDRNWQRLILTHLTETDFPGVLTGSPLTDVKITLLAGRAHLKHTEGGDFRQATYRAVRQGLRKAKSVLLEPWYDFEMEVPQDMTGRAMADIQRMGGSFELPQMRGDMSLLTGKAPVSEMKGYMAEINSYARGYGYLGCSVSGYEPCHDAKQVIEDIGYRVDMDTENTADSVFCSHGAGYLVPWDQVDDHVHVILDRSMLPNQNEAVQQSAGGSGTWDAEDFAVVAEETLQKRTQRSIEPHIIEGEKGYQKTKSAEIQKEYLIVDGYNIIFAWDELNSLSRISMDAARTALIEILSNYQGYRKCKVIAVFDAYKIKGGERRQEKHGAVDVVFTKEAETADTYIERLSYEMNGKYRVRVATSDRQEQIIALGNGAFRLSASELKAEIQRTNLEISAFLKEHARKNQIRNRNNIQVPKK